MRRKGISRREFLHQQLCAGSIAALGALGILVPRAAGRPLAPLAEPTEPRIRIDKGSVILVTGGTGIAEKDVTIEAVKPLLDKELEGIGELFRWLSYQDIGTSTVASRALGGVANGTFVFCLPGSTGACRTGWDEIIAPQLDCRNRPCNMVELMPRLTET